MQAGLGGRWLRRKPLKGQSLIVLPALANSFVAVGIIVDLRCVVRVETG